MAGVASKGYNDVITLEQRTQILAQLGQQRWKDAENGTPFYDSSGSLPDKLTGNEPQFVAEYQNYYKTPRGFHPRSINSNAAWSATSVLSLMNMPILTYFQEISPRPMLVIAGKMAHSRYFSEDIYKAAVEPKELMINPGAVHTDLYDKTDLIPFNKLEAFFKENLN